MLVLNEYKSLEELKNAIAQMQVDIEHLLDWESERKLSKWLEEIEEADKARQLVDEYDTKTDNPSLILKILTFSEEEIRNIVNEKAVTPSNYKPKSLTAEELTEEVKLLKRQISLLNEQRLPIGTIALFPIDNTPPGWLKCEGQCLSISCFEALFARLRQTWGSNKNSFFLPNLSQQACNTGLCYCIHTGKYQDLPTGAVTSLLQFTVNGVSFNMIFVEGGSFMMGATQEQETEARDDEKPVHHVTLSSYYIGQFQVTQALWKAVMKNNPSYFKGNTLPVENMPYDQCNTFIQKLNELTGEHFRLPTEAEWEFAARGGRYSQGFKYSGSNILSDVAWFTENSDDKTHPVGKKQSNELGIYDMSGNVREWCKDWYGSYDNIPKTNPKGPSKGNCHVYRGGNYLLSNDYCRVTSRCDFAPYESGSDFQGFRLALTKTCDNL